MPNVEGKNIRKREHVVIPPSVSYSLRTRRAKGSDVVFNSSQRSFSAVDLYYVVSGTKLWVHLKLSPINEKS